MEYFLHRTAGRVVSQILPSAERLACLLRAHYDTRQPKVGCFGLDGWFQLDPRWARQQHTLVVQPRAGRERPWDRKTMKK